LIVLVTISCFIATGNSLTSSSPSSKPQFVNIMPKFLHTADLQIGKPFAMLEDQTKRVNLQQKRISSLQNMQQLIEQHKLEFVVVCGDFFDNNTPSRAVILETCEAVGRLGVPVYVIPGNHDHGGRGSVWEQSAFLEARDKYAPNLQVLLDTAPLELKDCYLLPCPLLAKFNDDDVMAHLRAQEFYEQLEPHKARIVLAHGSINDFSSKDQQDRDDTGSKVSNNLLELGKLPMEQLDYVALGDWHGFVKIDAKCYYSGTPEIDRFPRGSNNQPGHVAVVELQRGRPAKVNRHYLSSVDWRSVHFELDNAQGLQVLQQELDELLGKAVNSHCLKLELEGELGFEAFEQLEEQLEELRARVLHLDVLNNVLVSDEQGSLAELLQNSGSGMALQVYRELESELQQGKDPKRTAVLQQALLQLFKIAKQLQKQQA